MPPSFMIPPKKRKLDTPAKRIHHGPTSTFKLPSTPARNVSTAARFDGYKAAFASPSPSPRIATDGSATTRAFRTLDLPFSLDCSSPTPHKSRADSATPAPTPSNETQLAKRPYSPALTSLSRTHPPLFPSSASSPRPTKKLRVIEAPHILLASQKPPVTPSPARSKNLSIPPQWNMKQIAAATQESFDSSSTLPTIKNGESKFRRYCLHYNPVFTFIEINVQRWFGGTSCRFDESCRYFNHAMEERSGKTASSPSPFSNQASRIVNSLAYAYSHTHTQIPVTCPSQIYNAFPGHKDRISCTFHPTSYSKSQTEIKSTHSGTVTSFTAPFGAYDVSRSLPSPFFCNAVSATG